MGETWDWKETSCQQVLTANLIFVLSLSSPKMHMNILLKFKDSELKERPQKSTGSGWVMLL